MGAGMNKKFNILVILSLLLLSCRPMLGTGGLDLYDVTNHQILTHQAALMQLQKARIILVGEHHTNLSHHQAQLSIIKALHQSGRKLAIGLEMFRQNSQGDLDRWVKNQINTSEFESIYLDNWNFEWPLYQPIFQYARDNRIPMIGLNIPRQITRQVAYHGFNSLSPEQKEPLDDLVCDVTPEYRDYIRQAYGGHGHGQMNFDNFCQAQLLWDTAMAMHAGQYLQVHDGVTMILLAGSGHAQKQGIPTQLKKYGQWRTIVILPETPGIYDMNKISAVDADFLLLNRE